MTKLALSAALAVALSSSALADTIAPSAGSLAPGTRTRVERLPHSARSEHCSRKADGVRVQGKARELYMRKCVKG